MLITPLTKFSKIKEIIVDDSDDSNKDVYYQRNYPNGFKTHYYAYRAIIFEVIVESDYVASVTLFRT